MSMRLDRQMRVPGWDQASLSNKRVALVGNSPILDHLLFSAAQLGINHIATFRYGIDEAFLPLRKNGYSETARPSERAKPYELYTFDELLKRMNPESEYLMVDSTLVNGEQMLDFLDGSETVVDASNYGLSKQVSINWMNSRDKKGILVSQDDQHMKFFTYAKGRENEDLLKVIPSNPLPIQRPSDQVAEVVGAGLVLEELKNILMGKEVSDCLVEYPMGRKAVRKEDYSGKSVLYVGCGALGTYELLSMYPMNVGRADMMDPDIVDETNLNRQPLYFDSVGEPKALVSSKRIKELTSNATKSSVIIKEFTDKTSVKEYDVVFDGVDNVSARLQIIEACKRDGVPLISGGTSYDGGQVTVYIPGKTKSPDEIIGWTKLLQARRENEARNPSCIYQPNPSVIMSGQIIGGIMVSEMRKLFYPENYGSPITNGKIVYDANSPKRIGVVKLDDAK
jgi:molybdopterin/thiamine biosynthesis adenylyltransferase